MKKLFKKIGAAIDSWLKHVPTDTWLRHIWVQAELARIEEEKEREQNPQPVEAAMMQKELRCGKRQDQPCGEGGSRYHRARCYE